MSVGDAFAGALTGSSFGGVLVPRRNGWAIDRGQFGVHDVDGYFDPFVNRKIRVQITVVPLADVLLKEDEGLD